ncbi:probable inactive purple acid phosphatase 28 isoform X2 [Musa acuminata AAA Group]|uniref:probable inactive purple acid phosphatase 28 isoform X3 n=1 Tax=Musa acuminata AAA Group TaxID=214697 RepID=UPI0031DD0F09
MRIPLRRRSANQVRTRWWSWLLICGTVARRIPQEVEWRGIWACFGQVFKIMEGMRGEDHGRKNDSVKEKSEKTSSRRESSHYKDGKERRAARRRKRPKIPGMLCLMICPVGDNIFGASATDAAESLFKVFRPAMESRTPWAPILGNHDQESTMTREELMSFISLMDYSVSQVNPSGFVVDGYGNYDIRVHGAWGSGLANTSVLNLYFLDSGDRVMVSGVRTYGWIRDSQLTWLHTISEELQSRYPAPALSFFHIPIPEVRDLWFRGFVGQFQEAVACSSVKSGILQSLSSMGDVKAVFIGHDHLNDFCGKINGIWFCYGGGFGYHGYGRVGWPRRARVISAHLAKGKEAWMGVETIRTWKRLDDDKLTKIDEQLLWSHDHLQPGTLYL